MRIVTGWACVSAGLWILARHGPLAYPDVTPMRLFLTYPLEQVAGGVLLIGGFLVVYSGRESDRG